MASNLCGPAGSSGTLLIDIRENSLNSVLLMDKDIKHKLHDNKVLENKVKLFYIYICKNKHRDSMEKIRFQVSLAQRQIRINYLCINARIRSFPVIIWKSGIEGGGVKQSHWITIAFWSDCKWCWCATSEKSSSYLLGFVCRDLESTLHWTLKNN